jgi:hypothetical protein
MEFKREMSRALREWGYWIPKDEPLQSIRLHAVKTRAPQVYEQAQVAAQERMKQLSKAPGVYQQAFTPYALNWKEVAQKSKEFFETATKNIAQQAPLELVTTWKEAVEKLNDRLAKIAEKYWGGKEKKKGGGFWGMFDAFKKGAEEYGRSVRDYAKAMLQKFGPRPLAAALVEAGEAQEISNAHVSVAGLAMGGLQPVLAELKTQTKEAKIQTGHLREIAQEGGLA